MTVTDLDWQPHAASLADAVAADVPAWRDAVASTPRHLLVPRWWNRSQDVPGGWTLSDGSASPQEWMNAAYSDTTLVTRAGALHADHAGEGQTGNGEPTSSSTMPGLVITMLRLLDAQPGMTAVDVATGSGYSAALLSHALGSDAVLSVDVDPYLTEAAGQRLAALGIRPRIETVDATGPLPADGFDRLVAMVSARGIPASWRAAVRPGGQLVTTIANTSLMVIAEKHADGTATGHIAAEQGHFMTVRSTPDYPDRLPEGYRHAREAEGEEVTKGRCPLPDWWNEPDLSMIFELAAPDTVVQTMEREGRRMLWLFQEDGSWARATATGDELPVVHQSGPRRLWAELEQAEARWDAAGRFDLRELAAAFTPDGDVLSGPADWSVRL
ncbi:protein-L-isoaspartate(D-aspartate) O-methyltransferase [Streptomyces olivoreticuli]